jgi:hypothetical protein
MKKQAFGLRQAKNNQAAFSTYSCVKETAIIMG